MLLLAARLADLYFSDVTTEAIGGIHRAIDLTGREGEQILTWSCAKPCLMLSHWNRSGF